MSTLRAQIRRLTGGSHPRICTSDLTYNVSYIGEARSVRTQRSASMISKKEGKIQAILLRKTEIAFGLFA